MRYVCTCGAPMYLTFPIAFMPSINWPFFSIYDVRMHATSIKLVILEGIQFHSNKPRSAYEASNDSAFEKLAIRFL